MLYMYSYNVIHWCELGLYNSLCRIVKIEQNVIPKQFDEDAADHTEVQLHTILTIHGEC